MANVSNFETAKMLFMRYLGYPLMETEYTDTIRYGSYGARLKHPQVVKLISVKGRTDDYNDWMLDYAFGISNWNDINIDNCFLYKNDRECSVTVPPTLFGTPYKEIQIVYTAGLTEMPEDVKLAIEEIETLLDNGDITEWNCIFPASVHDVLQKYRKEVD